MPDSVQKFCLIVTSYPCFDIVVARQRIFGIPELISGVAFLAVPWSMMSAESKLKLSMSFLGEKKHTLLNSILAFTIAASIADYASMSIISEHSHIQFYIQQFQFFLALMYVIFFYLFVKSFFVKKQKLTKVGALTLSEEIRTVNVTNGTHYHTSGVLAETIPDLMVAIEPLSQRTFFEFGKLIDSISSDSFVRFISKNNPHVASELSKNIAITNVNPEIFDRFFSNFTKHVVMESPYLIDDFVSHVAKRDGHSSILGAVYFNDRLLRNSSSILTVHELSSRAEVERLIAIIIPAFHHATAAGIFHSRTICSGLVFLSAYMMKHGVPITPAIFESMRRVNVDLSEMPCDVSMDADDPDELLTIHAWSSFFLEISSQLAVQKNGNAHMVRIYFHRVLGISSKKNTFGRALTRSLIQNIAKHLQGYSLNNDSFTIKDILNMAFPSKRHSERKESNTLQSLNKIWHRRRYSFKDSI